MTQEEAYDRAKALVSQMYAINADAHATERAVSDVADALFDAVKAERERCVKLIRDFDPAPDYHTDEDGNEYAVGVTWEAVQEPLIRLLREGEQH